MTDPRNALVYAFRKRYEQEIGVEMELGFGAMMNMLYHFFEITDQKTGEIYIEYPSLEGWKNEIDGFFDDPWAASVNFAFTCFLGTKQGQKYGTWKKVVRKPAPKKVPEYFCEECKANHKVFMGCPLENKGAENIVDGRAEFKKSVDNLAQKWSVK